MSAHRSARRLASFVAVLCIACAGLVLELLQTRILSALYINHVVYLTVTVALLGFGISGALVSILKERIRDPLAAAALALGAFAVLTPACVYLASHSTVLFLEQSTVLKLLFCYA